MKDCLFCKIVSGEIASLKVFETNDFKVILDKFPATKGHTLIIPKEHFDDIYDMDSETAGKLFALATVVARSMKKVLGLKGLNVIQNNGELAGQTIKHFHLHLVPRYENDGFEMKQETKTFTDDELEALCTDLSKNI